jgi:hypothetical protein
MCKKYSICEIILGILVIVLAFWKTLPYQEWVLTLIGIGLIFHSFVCKFCKCNCSCDNDEGESSEKPKVKSRTSKAKK